jgi:hypothetical protein
MRFWHRVRYLSSVTGDPLIQSEPSTANALRRWLRRFWWTVPAALVAVAAIVIISQTAVYQPLVFGGEEGAVPGPGGQHIRIINNSEGQTGQYFVPPFISTFGLTFSVTNVGSHTITIEGASVNNPDFPTPPWPLTPVGPALHEPNVANPLPQRLAGLSIVPNQTITIELKFRFVSECYIQYGWTGFNTVYVRTRYVTFSHTLRISLPLTFIFHEPATVGANGLICPASA